MRRCYPEVIAQPEALLNDGPFLPAFIQTVPNSISFAYGSMMQRPLQRLSISAAIPFLQSESPLVPGKGDSASVWGPAPVRYCVRKRAMAKWLQQILL